jgi:hypothetical protein
MSSSTPEHDRRKPPKLTHFRKASAPFHKSILIEKNTKEILEPKEEIKEEVTLSDETIELLEFLDKCKDKVCDGDREHFSTLAYKDLIIRNPSEMTLIYAFRMKQRNQIMKKNKEMWNNISKFVK